MSAFKIFLLIIFNTSFLNISNITTAQNSMNYNCIYHKKLTQVSMNAN